MQNIPLESLYAQLPGYWGCKSLDSQFVYVNPAYARLMGFINTDECIGLYDFDMPGSTAKFAQEFRQQDRYVIENNCTIKVLDIHPYPDGNWHTHIFTKTPWLNEDGTIKGTIFYGQDLTDTAILEVGHWVCRATGLNRDSKAALPQNSIQLPVEKLTSRESEVLFLLLYGKKPTYIAAAMNISIKTFESYVMRLRHKFKAHSKAQLIDIALDTGYGSRIPETLLKTQISVVLNNENAA